MNQVIVNTFKSVDIPSISIYTEIATRTIPIRRSMAMSPLLTNSLLSLLEESMIRLVTAQAPKTADNYSKICSV